MTIQEGHGEGPNYLLEIDSKRVGRGQLMPQFLSWVTGRMSQRTQRFICVCVLALTLYVALGGSFDLSEAVFLPFGAGTVTQPHKHVTVKRNGVSESILQTLEVLFYERNMCL